MEFGPRAFKEFAAVEPVSDPLADGRCSDCFSGPEWQLERDDGLWCVACVSAVFAEHAVGRTMKARRDRIGETVRANRAAAQPAIDALKHPSPIG